MCGIAGSFGEDDFDLKRALDAIAHRGPDDRGVLEHLGIRHGHVRLAIQDPTAGSRQPFAYRDGVLSYNGELWNADVLRARLEKLGHRFRTSGDTEVLAASLSQWGRCAVDELDGMFCFAWSSPRERILVRSRFGSLPLYVEATKRGFAWSSERKAWGVRAIVANALPPATILDLETRRLETYYVVPQLENPDPERVEAMLLEGVRKRMIADVPLCALLSGGVDSSVVVAMAARLRPDIVCYVVSSVDGSEDVAAARIVAAHVGVELREIRVPLPTFDDLGAAIRTVEVPNPTSIEAAALVLPFAKRIREDGFKVVLTGEASDELFGGYGTLARRATSDKAWRAARLDFLGKMGRADFHRVNKTFMAHGIEARMPFIDRALVEATLSMTRAQCPPGKKLLRRIAERWIPKEIAWREKKPFHVPSGTREHCRGLVANHVRYYNAELTKHFGGIVRG